MAKSNAQRIGIIIMAVVMAVGTIGSFFIVIVANQNQQIDARAQEEKNQRMQELMEEYQAEYAVYEEEITKKYYDTLKKYESEVGTFDNSKVKELKTKDLVKGDGDKVEETGDMMAFYIGWTADGEVFDSSIDGEKLRGPLPVENTIEGWQEGVIGMNIGGVRKITIPSEMAYGEAGMGESIPPNSALKFIVIAISPDEFTEPEPSEELTELMNSMGGLGGTM